MNIYFKRIAKGLPFLSIIMGVSFLLGLVLYHWPWVFLVAVGLVIAYNLGRFADGD